MKQTKKLNKTDCPMKGRMCQCSDTAKCIHQPIEELQPYAERSREDCLEEMPNKIEKEYTHPDCGHNCTSNCRRNGCNCLCGEYHGQLTEE